MSKLISINEASKRLGVSISTLRRWDKAGLLIAERTPKGHRRYDISKINPNLLHGGVGCNKARKTIAYARVSSQSERNALQHQIQVLEMYCAKQGWTFELIHDLGSGVNYHKKGFTQLLNGILENQIGRLVITHRDRLLSFGGELFFALCEARNVEVILINQGENLSFAEELGQDVLEMINALYGTNKKLLAAVQEALETQQ